MLLKLIVLYMILNFVLVSANSIYNEDYRMEYLQFYHERGLAFAILLFVVGMILALPAFMYGVIDELLKRD
nr:MAG TPA: Phospholamban [Caudoviricetes sp.]